MITQKVQIKVICPLDSFKWPAEIVYVIKEDGTKVPFPCRGCDNRHDDPLCPDCAVALTLMFFHGADFKNNEIVTPDFSITQ